MGWTGGSVSIPVFGPSGGSHSTGLVPDPGATSGSTRYLREDASWVVPSGSGGGMSIGGAITSGTANSVLYVGAGGVLAQDNTNFNWNDSTGALTIQNILNFTGTAFTISLGGTSVLTYGAEPTVGAAAVISSVDLAVENANGATAIHMENLGTGGKDFAFFSTGPSNGFGAGAYGQYNYTDGRGVFVYKYSGNAQITMDLSAGFGWASDQYGTPANADTLLWRGGAGIVEQRNGTNAQTFRAYNTYTSSTSYERGTFDWQETTNVLTIGSEAGSGGGTVRDVQLIASTPFLYWQYSLGNLSLGNGKMGTSGGGLTGSANICMGTYGFPFLTSGSINLGIGQQCMLQLNTGTGNVGIGNQCLDSISSGSYNVGIGYQAGVLGNYSYSVLIGNQCNANAAHGGYSVQVGHGAGYSCAGGSTNTFVGYQAGAAITSGNNNTLLGAWQGPAGAMSSVVALSDGAGNLLLDYGYTTSSAWSVAKGKNLALLGSTSGAVTLGVAAAAGTWTLQLPANAGTSGYVLQTNGSGVTSWVSPGTATMAIGSAVTSGTSGSVLFINSSGQLAQDNGKFFWDDTNFCLVFSGVASNSNGGIAMSGTNTIQWTLDTGIGRNGSGIMEINNATLGTFRDLKLRSLLPAAGTASAAPITLTSGTNLTTPAAGAFEFDGTCFYETSVASARQVSTTEQFVNQTATRTFTSNTSAQAIFNATTNGAITLAGSTTYAFEMYLALSTLSSSTHTVSLGFGGTATLTSIAYWVDSVTLTALATGAATTFFGFLSAATASVCTASGTNTFAIIRARGTIRINAAGTLIPQLTQNTASAAAVLQIGSFARFWPLGSNTVTNVGNWS